jgi:peptide/nickel transport system ATP-binding protein
MPWTRSLPRMDSMGQLNIQNLSIHFRSREGIVQAVNDIDLKIKEGEIVGLVGESGSGKSVTCNSILQLLPCPPAEISHGTIEWTGDDLLKKSEPNMVQIRGKEISMIFQDPMSCLNPYLTVLEQVAEPLIIHNLATPTEAMQQASDILAEVGVDRILTSPNAYPHEFSGGMRQRVMIAMALITKPALLLADEPTTALDVTVQAKILSILKEACLKRKISVLFVSHDLGLVAELADRVVVMYRGKVIEQKDTASLFQNPEHPYVKALIACRPTLESSSDRLPTVEEFTNPNSSSISTSESSTSTMLLHQRKVLLETKELTVEFSSTDGKVRAVKDVSLAIREGTTHGLVGESGSGKTTLGRSILQLLKKTAGEILLHGKPIDIGNAQQQLHFRRSMQIIFQDPYASLNPRLTIEQTLIEPMIVHGIGDNKKNRKERVVALLEEVGLASEHLSRYPHQFSGGQRQRICVARALTIEPKFIVCDECVSAMDVSVQAQVLNLLKSLQESRGLTYLFISHDLGVVKFMSDEISVMQHGTVVETGTVDAIYQNPQTEYTRQLIEAIPRANRSMNIFS